MALTDAALEEAPGWEKGRVMAVRLKPPEVSGAGTSPSLVSIAVWAPRVHGGMSQGEGLMSILEFYLLFLQGT